MLCSNLEARLTIKDPNCIQLYSAATPNGIKVAAMLEELVDLKSNTGEQFNYEPHTIDISKGESRSQWYKEVAPHGKIPLLIDLKAKDGSTVTVFESGAILLYLAEKYEELLPPSNLAGLRADTLKWLFWGSTAMSTQAKTFGFYYKYCTHEVGYCVDNCVGRYSEECNRLLVVLEDQLRQHRKLWVVGDMYTIADLSIWPWVQALYVNYGDTVLQKFNDFNDYPFTKAWYLRCIARPASKRAMDVTQFNMETS